MNPLKIAVIGSGISGLSAAWLLDKKHHVTVYEADDRLGGHTNTVDMDIVGEKVAVDTGFICFNSATYPNLIALFDHLDVDVYDTNMSFAASMGSGKYEYSGGTYFGLFGQPSNILSRRHWRVIKDILRFFKQAPAALETLDDTESLSAFLKRENYSDEFARFHLLPMAAAIWSSRLEDMLDYPAKSFIRFFRNHGLLQVEGRPKWGTVQGGSRTYVKKLLADAEFAHLKNHSVSKVERRADGVIIHTPHGPSDLFDQVVIASHADQALAMLDAPSHDEQTLLGAFGYSKNTAVLHRDVRLMPKRKLTWASWNYLDFATKPGMENNPDLCLTYWMNSLQNLPTKENVFVTLNPSEEREIENIAARIDYMHPVFDGPAMAAQRELWSLQGVNRTWFCGAHFGAGFHEDGLQSGLAVAEQLGNVRRPWNVAEENGRIYVHGSRAIREAAE